MTDYETPTKPGAVVINANALELPLPDESVDLIITSPPYFALRSYRDSDEHYDGQIGSEPTPQEFLEALWAATREMVRVLKPSGSIWVNLGDKYAGSGGHNNAAIGGAGRGPSSYNKASGDIPAKSLMGLPWRYANGCVDQLGLILRANIIWSKPNGLPESVTDRVRRSHEDWFHFTKQGRYFAAVDEVREAHAPDSFAKVATDPSAPLAESSMGVENGRREWRNGLNPLGKLPGSVWTIASEPLIVPEHLGLPDHFAAFPQEWPRRIILGWSPSGICTACGEGRRPVCDVERTPFNGDPRDQRKRTSVNGGERKWLDVERTITGYACACTENSAQSIGAGCTESRQEQTGGSGSHGHPSPPPPTRPAVILDPFGGTGTVAMVARALGRYGISVDLSADYCRLAQWRIFHSGHAAKTEQRTWADRQQGLFP